MIDICFADGSVAIRLPASTLPSDVATFREQYAAYTREAWFREEQSRAEELAEIAARLEEIKRQPLDIPLCYREPKLSLIDTVDGSDADGERRKAPR